MDQLLLFLEKAWQPTSLLYVAFYSFVICISLFYFLKIFIKRIWNRVLFSIICSLFYFIVFFIVIPHFSKFKNEEFGILLLNTTGANLKEYLGDEKFNEKLFAEFNIELPAFAQKIGFSNLSEIIKFQAVSWSANSSDDAIKLLNKYNAKAVFWGNLTKLQNTAIFSGYVQPGNYGMTIYLPINDSLSIDMSWDIGPKFQFDFGDTSYNFNVYCDKILKYSLPAVGAYLYSKGEYSFSAQIFGNLPRASADYRNDDYAGLFILACANSLEQINKPYLAARYYSDAFTYLNGLINRWDSSQIREFYTKDQIKLVCSLSKALEGNFYRKMGKIDLTNKCWIDAFLVGDSKMRELIRHDYSQVFHASIDSVCNFR
jgi:hypothetical protein